MPFAGAPLRRVEDRPLLVGAGRFVDDLRLTGMLHMAVVRSPHAHARLVGVAADDARAAPGVVAVITASDLPVPTPRIAVPPVFPGLDSVAHPLLAGDVVRYAGEPVAAIVARSRYEAEDAAERVRARFEVLPPVTDVDAAIAPGAPVLHAGRASNLVFAHAVSGGDPDAAFRRAAVDADVLVDLGAYCLLATASIPARTPLVGLGAYRTANARYRIRGVVTTKAPTGPYRGAGRPEAAYYIERVMDALAARLGMDPAEIRRRNFITAFPYTSPTGLTYDSGDYRALLDRALALAGYARWRAEQATRRAAGGPPIGIGLSTWIEVAGGAELWESGAVRLDASGHVAKVLQYTAVDDCGRVINPLLVRGQAHGSVAQGLTQALREQVVYGEDGSLLTPTLLEYAVPKAADLPAITWERIESPSPLNPLGAKGAGESGTIGAPPALANAVDDALRPLTNGRLALPLTPERVWRAFQGAQAR